MKQKPDIIRSKSPIPYNYSTIKITQSRIDKGLIAIPAGLAESFPDHNENIQVYLNESPASETKQYSSYTSSTHECRIGGLREWFEQNNIKSGDEIVIQFLDRDRFIYRLTPERNFVLATQQLQDRLDKSETEQDASEEIITLSRWTHLEEPKVTLNEYYRLATTLPLKERSYLKKPTSRARENVPANLRTLLEGIYRGHCQVCDFWFLKRDNEPYFEIHHVDPLKGHHPKNLLVVCGNCHNQFEHTNLKEEFNDELWLVRVTFNANSYPVNQAILSAGIQGFFKELYV